MNTLPGMENRGDFMDYVNDKRFSVGYLASQVKDALYNICMGIVHVLGEPRARRRPPRALREGISKVNFQ